MREKGWIGVIAALAILLSVLPHAEAEVGLKVEENSGADTAKIPITISSPQGVTGLQFKLRFDPAVLKVSDDKVLVLGELTRGWSAKSNHGEGWVMVVMFNPSLKPLDKAGGIIAYVSLKVNDSMENGRSSTLSLTDVVVADNKGNAMPSSAANGMFTKKDSNATPGKASEDEGKSR